MTDGRLDQLALGYINQERTFSPDSALQAWDRSGHRRIALAFHDRVDIYGTKTIVRTSLLAVLILRCTYN